MPPKREKAAASGPLLPDLHALAPEHAVLERRNMNAWEDDSVRAAIEATGRQMLTPQ